MGFIDEFNQGIQNVLGTLFVPPPAPAEWGPNVTPPKLATAETITAIRNDDVFGPAVYTRTNEQIGNVMGPWFQSHEQAAVAYTSPPAAEGFWGRTAGWYQTTTGQAVNAITGAVGAAVDRVTDATAPRMPIPWELLALAVILVLVLVMK